MDLGTKMLYILMDLILPLIVGYACRRKEKPGEQFFQRLMEFSMFFVYPVLAVLTFWVLSLNYSFLWLPIAGILMIVVPGIAAYWRVPAKFTREIDQGTYILCAMMSNTTTLGGLCAFIIYGEAGYAYMQMVTMSQNAFMFLFCFPLGQYYYQKSRQGRLVKQSLRDIILHRNQLPVAGMIIGAALHSAGVVRPGVVGALVDPLVHISAWTALLPIGYSIDFTGMRQYYRATLDQLAIKFFLTPVILYFLSSLVIDDHVVLNTVLVLAMAPTAILAVVAVKINCLNIHLAMASFVLTTTIFVGALFPLVLFFLSR